MKIIIDLLSFVALFHRAPGVSGGWKDLFGVYNKQTNTHTPVASGKMLDGFLCLLLFRSVSDHVSHCASILNALDSRTNVLESHYTDLWPANVCCLQHPFHASCLVYLPL